MKKVIGLLLVAGMLICTLCGCGGGTKSGKADDPSAYTYIVKPLQGVSECVYYGPDDEVPNCTDQEAARNKIHVWTVCPTCGGEGFAWNFKIDVKDLDFSSGDTIQFTDNTICESCRTNRGIPSFMWSISITREKIK